MCGLILCTIANLKIIKLFTFSNLNKIEFEMEGIEYNTIQYNRKYADDLVLVNVVVIADEKVMEMGKRHGNERS